MSSLLELSKVDCVLLERHKEPDGEGGFVSAWSEGAPFKAAISVNVSSEMQIAEANGLKRIYTVITNKSAKLDHNDIFKRISDGATFRVTSDGADNETPDTAGINASQVTAERWELPQ